MIPAVELLRRFVADDAGQDLVEYALLGALLAVTGLAAYLAIQGGLRTSMSAWDSNVQDLWEMPAPGGS